MSAIPYWIQSTTGTTYLKVDRLAPGQQRVFKVRGEAGYVPDIDSTMLFGDDFKTQDTNKWNFPTYWSVSDGLLKASHSDWVSRNESSVFSEPLTSMAEDGVIIEYYSRNLGNVSAYDMDCYVYNTGRIGYAYGTYDSFFGGTLEDWGYDPRNWIHVKAQYKSGDNKLWFNDNLVKTSTAEYTAFDHVGMRSKGSSEWDYIFFRKYAAVEPTVQVVSTTDGYNIIVTNTGDTELTDYQVAVNSTDLGISTTDDSLLIEPLDCEPISFWHESTTKSWTKVPELLPFETRMFYVEKTPGYVPNGKAIFDMFFSGESVDSANFDIGSGVTSDGSTLQIVGPAFASRTWGPYYYVSKQKFSRPFVFEIESKGVGSRGDFMVGAFDNDGGYSYTEMVYASYQYPDKTTRGVYEDAAGRVYQGKTTNADTWYNDEIVVYDTGADYHIDDTVLYNSSYSSEDNLRVGITAASSTQQFRNMRVRKYMEVEPTVTVKDCGSFCQITVTNNTPDTMSDVQVSFDSTPLNLTSTDDSLLILPMNNSEQSNVPYLDLFDGCVAYYDFMGDAQDVMGNHDGVVTGASLTTDHMGIQGAAYSFDGVDDYIELANSTTIDFDSNFTVCAMIKSTMTGAWLTTIIGKYGFTSISESWALGWMDSNVLGFYIRDSAGTRDMAHLSSGEALDGNWHFLVATVSSSEVKFFLDGLLKMTTPRTAGSVINSRPVTIGAHLTTFTNMDISYGSLIGRTLSDSEIKALTNLVKHGYPYPIMQKTEVDIMSASHILSHASLQSLGCKMWIPLNGDVYDYSGNGNNLTLTGINYTANLDGTRFAYIDSKSDIMSLSTSISDSHITVCAWYYFEGTGGTWNTIFCRNDGTYHHLLIQDSDNQIGFYNSSFYGSGFNLVENTWYFIRLEKNGTNSKLYINEDLKQDSNSSFDNASYPLKVIGNYGGTNQDQGSLGKLGQIFVFQGGLDNNSSHQLMVTTAPTYR